MKFLAGAIIVMGFIRLTIINIALFMDTGTAVERIDGRFDAMVLITLGAILWQITRLLNRD